MNHWKPDMSDSAGEVVSISQSAPGITVGEDAGQRSGKGAVLAVACAACSLIVLDTNVVAVSLPSIAQSFRANFSDIEWVISAYMTTFAAFLLPAGALADRFGRKRMLLRGLALFAGASLACGWAPTASGLIAARAVKGIGAAILLTAALSVIAHGFVEERARARAWALWGMCMGTATALAPWLGGAITQWVGWRWIFLINIPLCALIGIGAMNSVRESRDPAAKRLDFAGGGLFACALACLVWGLIGIPVQGLISATSLSRFAASAALLGAFVFAERRQVRPMVDLNLFRQGRFVGSVLGMFGYAACAQVMMTFLPLYLQVAFGFSAVNAGLGMLPFAAAMVVGPMIGKVIGPRVGMGGVLSTGLAFIALGNLVTAAFAANGHYYLIVVPMVVTGVGAGIMNGDTQKAIMACVPQARMGMASGISTTTRFTAIVASVGVLGATLAARAEASLDALLSATHIGKGAVDMAFLSSLLAGDLHGALQSVNTNIAPLLADAAPVAFAKGFSASLLVSGVVALLLAVAVRILVRVNPALE
jgi:EmrB/QacA subfamily drug resistance transporter